jgi:hypothetical protein
MEFLNPISKKTTVYFESKLSKPTNRTIGVLPFKKPTVPHYEYSLTPADKIAIGNYWQLRTENKQGRSKYLTIINDFLTRRYPIVEVKIPLKSAGAIAHTLNSIIMHHRIRNVAAACLKGNAVLFLLDP